jgi:hypothetical protein
MIILDEHLSNETMKMAIARWYQGKVAFVGLYVEFVTCFGLV